MDLVESANHPIKSLPERQSAVDIGLDKTEGPQTEGPQTEGPQTEGPQTDENENC